MASRHLKRLQDADIKLQEADSSGEEAEESLEPEAKANPFSFLAEEEEESEEASSSHSDENGEMKGPEGGKQDESKRETSQAGSKKADAKKSRGAKKKAAKKSKAEGQKESAAGEEDLDTILKSLDIKIEERPAPGNDEGPCSIGNGFQMLQVNTRKLKIEDELRRIFGSKFINSGKYDEDEGQPGLAHATRKVRRLAARGLIRRAQLKSGYIIQPRDDWPPANGDLEMILDTTCAPSRVYKYVWTARYKAAQLVFEQTQGTHDPNQLIQLTALQPYHVDTLNAASELYRASGQNETADDFLARSLYALELAWPASFLPGSSTLSASVPENLPLFKTLFKYIQTLIRRGLYATAMENAKMLLSLNHSDPAGILFCIDYIVIRARQYSFLKDLSSSMDPEGGLFSQLPHWTYSTALAAYLQAQEAGSPLTDSLKPGISAVQLYPSTVVALLEKLEDKGVHPDQEFKQALRHRHFKDACEHGNASLSHLESIYVERQYTLYKEARMLNWLKQCCQAATQKGEEQQLQDWNATRKEWWPPENTNKHSSLRLSDFTDDVAALPPGELPWQNRGGDEAEGEFVRIMENFDQLSEEERAEILQAANDPRVQAYLREMQGAGQGQPGEDEA